MSDKKSAPQLMDEPPLLVYPSLAVTLGINRAIVFQQLHFLLNGQKAAKNKYNFVDGRWWVYNSYPEWRADYFPWLSISTLKGIFNSLEDELLVIARQSVKYKSDRRKWYTIDYEVWDKKCLMMGQKLSHEPTDKNCPMDGTENGSSNRQKLADGLSEIPSETSSENTSETSGAKSIFRDGVLNPVIPKVPQKRFDIKYQHVWNAALNQLEVQLDRANFDTWLRGTWLIDIEDTHAPDMESPGMSIRSKDDAGRRVVFVIGTRNQFARDMLEHRLYRMVRRILSDAAGLPVEARYEIALPETTT